MLPEKSCKRMWRHNYLFSAVSSYSEKSDRSLLIAKLLKKSNAFRVLKQFHQDDVLEGGVENDNKYTRWLK
jgi:hypothetical protein